MSQEKVDRRKELKNNRKEIIAKEKRNRAFGRFAAWVVALIIVCGVGFSVYRKIVPAPEYDASGFQALIAQDGYGIITPSILGETAEATPAEQTADSQAEQ